MKYKAPVIIKRASEDEENEDQVTNLNYLVDLEARRIQYRGDVNELMSTIIIGALLKMSSISKEPIELYLSSFGGDAYEGLAIYDAIVACDCEIRIIASGKIMSAAFLIFLAGDVRIASDHTRFMMHSASYSAEGIVKNHEVQVNEGKLLNNLFLDIAAKRTKKDKKWWYRKILNSDFYCGLTEARELGIIYTKPTKSVVRRKVKRNVKRKV